MRMGRELSFQKLSMSIKYLLDKFVLSKNRNTLRQYRKNVKMEKILESADLQRVQYCIGGCILIYRTKNVRHYYKICLLLSYQFIPIQFLHNFYVKVLFNLLYSLNLSKNSTFIINIQLIIYLHDASTEFRNDCLGNLY